ncbi:uncharacterized protein LOC134822869 isoform X1 [Bolinopsis microptera]|uniref:uncharacterized protein LOC134822869 isoform X1 n=1 Tax=Bolinopsis microptera TaxID=2820187 RepID=UPI003079D7FD
MYRTYNFRPASPPAPCLVMPGAIAKGLSPIKLKPPSKQSFENSVVLRRVQPRSKRQAKNNNNTNSEDHNKKTGFKEYTFILPSVRNHNQCIITPIQLLNRDISPSKPPSSHHIPHSSHTTQHTEGEWDREVVLRVPSRAYIYNLSPTVTSLNNVNSVDYNFNHFTFKYSDTDSDYLPPYSEDSTGVMLGLQPGSPDPTYSNHGNTVLPYTHNHPGGGFSHNHTHHIEEDNKTTDHYSHWCDSKSCSSRISSGNLKDNMLGNIDVPNLYTTVTPKSFLPPSPLRSKQFVMPLKLHQLEPQQKKPPATSSDLTVTFVHRKMSDSSGNGKLSCNRNGATSKQSKNSANSSKQTSKQPDPTPSQPGYPDPLDHAPIAFINRLAEMTSHQADTVRFERNKRGKTRTRIS